MTERIQNMVASILQKTIYPESIEITYDRADYLLPERIRESKRLCDYMLAQEVAIPDGARLVGMIKFDKCPYPSDFMRKYGFKHTREIQQSFFDASNPPFEGFKYWGWQHATADFGRFIDLGVEGINEKIRASMLQHADDADKIEFLNACLIVCDGILAWEDKCAAECTARAEAECCPTRKAELLQMAENLRRVPRYPAQNFYEAVQTLYFCFDFLSDSLGLPDRWLLKTYRQDMANGTLTELKQMII
jgi:pyruvate-formate lyase